MSKQRRKRITKKRRKPKTKKNSRDPGIAFYLDKVHAEVQLQEESDSEFLAQANRFYSNRNLENGHANIVGDISEQIEKLPTLNHVQMQEFAFRYTMENRPLSYWAKEFGVNRKTLTNWLKRPDVNRFCILLRRNRYLRISAMRTRIDLAAMDELYQMIKLPTTDENYQHKAKLLMEVIKYERESRIQQRMVAKRPLLEDARKEMRQVGRSSVEDVIPAVVEEVDDIETAIAIVKEP